MKTVERPKTILDDLVGGPMGDSPHVFIIDENYNVSVWTANSQRAEYVVAGKLVANLSERDAEANQLEIIGSFPDSNNDHYYISMDWSKKFLTAISNADKQLWFRQLDALVALLLEKIKVQ